MASFCCLVGLGSVREMRITRKLPLVADQVVSKIVSYGVAFASVALIAMFVLIMSEIIARKVFNTSIYVSLEYTGYGLAIVIMFVLADLLKRRQHLAVGVIKDRLPRRIRGGAELTFSLVIFLLYCGFLTYLCFRLAKESYDLHIFSVSAARTPLWIPESLLVLGLVILLIALIAEIIKWFSLRPTK